VSLLTSSLDRGFVLDGREEMSSQAFEVDGPKGKRDEEPIVDIPEETGFRQTGDQGLEAVEFFDQRAAMGSPAEGELVEAAEVGLERAHAGSLKSKVQSPRSKVQSWRGR
jgi:hypothetical protein